MELPAPAYVGSMAGEDSGGARSPKYPSTVTKVCNTLIVLPVAWVFITFVLPAFMSRCL